MSRIPIKGDGIGPIMLWVGCGLLTALSTASDLKADDGPESGSPGLGRSQSEPDTPHHAVKRYEIGQGPRSYWIFEPDKPMPEEPAPVVVFLHGWFAVNPGFYGAWIDHLVRDGKIVIFPRYQNDVGTLPQDFLANSLEAIRDALRVLHAGVGHVRPDTGRFVLIGHSMGGNLAAQIAASAADPRSEIPTPQTLITLMPGEIIPIRKPSLADIPATTLMIVVVGDEDLVVGDHRGRQIFAEATSIPRSRKRFVLYRSDRHGFPPLIAEHTAPTGAHRQLDNGEGVLRAFQLSLGEVNALDRAGFWRMTDITLEAAAKGQTMDDVTRDLEQFRHLGFWSDGRRVNPPIIGADLEAIPRVIPGNGLRIFPWSPGPKASVALDANATIRP
jgi:acetyl esterase/lipase